MVPPLLLSSRTRCATTRDDRNLRGSARRARRHAAPPPPPPLFLPLAILLLCVTATHHLADAFSPTAAASSSIWRESASSSSWRCGAEAGGVLCGDKMKTATTLLFAEAPDAASAADVEVSSLGTPENEVEKISVADVEAAMAQCRAVLHRAADTRRENADLVYAALVDLERLSRRAAKASDPPLSYARAMLRHLHGSWRLVFTTGTASTQKFFLGGGTINYFPLKAIQSFDTTNLTIANGIYVGDFCALKFTGTFAFDEVRRKVEFDFDAVTVLQFWNIPLQRGQAAQLGAKSGLGSDANVVNATVKKGQKPAFFNWISADEAIATARGGGGGLALWRREAVPVVDDGAATAAADAP